MSTSVAGLSSEYPNKMYKNSFHWRHDSEELHVFEAARYFSAANDQVPGYINGVNISQKFIRDDRHNVQRPARRSLDMPMRPNLIPPDYHVVDHQKPTKENKKYKQPSSPGGRLASFLNSLFSQTHLKKKKSKSTTKEFEEESPGGRRKRRSSISHFRITSNATSSVAPPEKKSLYSSSNSGFRTPPPYANTPTKSYKEFRKLSDQAIPLPKNNGRNFKSTLLDELHAEKNGVDYAWIEEKLRISNGVSEKMLKNGNFGLSERNSNPSKEMEFKKFSETDDGADSDSSSDLFDLPNHDLDFYSSSLPVYETTHMDRIKIAAPISG